MVDNSNIFENLVDGILPEVIVRIDKVAQECGNMTRDSLATGLYKDLATEYRNGTLEEHMQSLQVETREKMLAAVDAYIEVRAANPDVAIYKKDPESELGQGTGQFSDSEVNDIVLFLIDNIVRKTRMTNRYDVMLHVCEILEHRFGAGVRLEQNLNKLNLRTTKDVLHAVDIYFIMKKLYPETVFGRKRMHTAWDKSFNACLPDCSDTDAVDEARKEAS